ncbi:hypothetical protein LEN26_010371 [Aphanomyces euteiches]|nr:hypothetical protein AeMF1_018837 [Aphanomyces euteiches]KAH9122115.1 hypothetical protein LEN26_010371 [Aphanomyces euteiches]KAH9196546.1 hypothetical protein AeNC1_001483 [Aphanomyces euteiches]
MSHVNRSIASGRLVKREKFHDNDSDVSPRLGVSLDNFNLTSMMNEEWSRETTQLKRLNTLDSDATTSSSREGDSSDNLSVSDDYISDDDSDDDEDDALYEPKPRICFESVYAMSTRDKIGEGTYGVVYAATHRESNARVAVKCFDKSTMDLADTVQLLREVDVLRMIHHSHVIKFVDFFDEPQHYYLVTELVNGGDLFDRLARRKVYAEEKVRALVLTLLKTVESLHGLNIVHGDLKLENILLTSTDNDVSIKLCDFGFARHDMNDELTGHWGSTDYMAPEIFSCARYGRQADVWSVGVITYMLLSGVSPFGGQTKAELVTNIQRGHVAFPAIYWRRVSAQAKAFVSTMLVANPRNRSTIQDLLAHPWLQEPAPLAIKSKPRAVN